MQTSLGADADPGPAPLGALGKAQRLRLMLNWVGWFYWESKAARRLQTLDVISCLLLIKSEEREETNPMQRPEQVIYHLESK